MDDDMDTINREVEEPVRGMAFDSNGKPAGITLDEWIDRLDRKLAAHYGDGFRDLLNEARADRGMSPLM
jgi:hypothetical protein